MRAVRHAADLSRAGLGTAYRSAQHARRLERVHEERRERHEQRPGGRARARAALRPRHRHATAEGPLDADDGRLRDEEEEAAADALAQLGLLQRERVLVEEARDGEGGEPAAQEDGGAAPERSETVRWKSPWMSMFHRRDQKSEMEVARRSGRSNMSCGE